MSCPRCGELDIDITICTNRYIEYVCTTCKGYVSQIISRTGEMIEVFNDYGKTRRTNV